MWRGGVTVDFKIPCNASTLKQDGVGSKRLTPREKLRADRGSVTSMPHHSKETLESCPAKIDVTHSTNCASGHKLNVELMIYTGPLFLLGAFHASTFCFLHGLAAFVVRISFFHVSNYIAGLVQLFFGSVCQSSSCLQQSLATVTFGVSAILHVMLQPQLLQVQTHHFSFSMNRWQIGWLLPRVATLAPLRITVVSKWFDLILLMNRWAVILPRHAGTCLETGNFIERN